MPGIGDYTAAAVASIAFDLPHGVLDGNVVRSDAGSKDIGKHSYVWDGLDGDGQAVPEGSYFIEVTMKNFDDDIVELPTSIFGRVTGVETTEDGALISLGDVHLPLTDILSVKESDPIPQS